MPVFKIPECELKLCPYHSSWEESCFYHLRDVDKNWDFVSKIKVNPKCPLSIQIKYYKTKKLIQGA